MSTKVSGGTETKVHVVDIIDLEWMLGRAKKMQIMTLKNHLSVDRIMHFFLKADQHSGNERGK